MADTVPAAVSAKIAELKEAVAPAAEVLPPRSPHSPAQRTHSCARASRWHRVARSRAGRARRALGTGESAITDAHDPPPLRQPVPETPPAAKEADAEAKVEEAAAAAEGAKDEPGLKDKLMKAKALAEEQLQEAKGTVDKIKGLFGK